MESPKKWTRDEINFELEKLANQTSGMVTKKLWIECFSARSIPIEDYTNQCDRCGAPLLFDKDFFYFNKMYWYYNTSGLKNFWGSRCKALQRVGINAGMHEFCPDCIQDLHLPHKVWSIPSIYEENMRADLAPIFKYIYDNEIIELLNLVELNEFIELLTPEFINQPEVLHNLSRMIEIAPITDLINSAPVTKTDDSLLYEGPVRGDLIFMSVSTPFSPTHYFPFTRSAYLRMYIDELVIKFLQGEDTMKYASENDPHHQYHSEALIAGICRFLNIEPSEKLLSRYKQLISSDTDEREWWFK